MERTVQNTVMAAPGNGHYWSLGRGLQEDMHGSRPPWEGCGEDRGAAEAEKSLGTRRALSLQCPSSALCCSLFQSEARKVGFAAGRWEVVTGSAGR